MYSWSLSQASGMDSSEVCWKFDIFPLRAFVAHGEIFHEERRGTFVPRVDSFLALVEPLLHLPQEGEGKQAELDAFKCDILDDDGFAQLKEVL